MLSLGGLISTADQRLRNDKTLSSVLGTRLITNFANNYDQSTGTWTDDVTAATLVQANSATRPVPYTTPIGNIALNFNGTNNEIRTDGGIAALVALPGRGTGGNSQRIWCCCFRAISPTVNGGTFYCTGSSSKFGTLTSSPNNIVWFDSGDQCGTNMAIHNSGWHRIIYLGDDTTSNVKIYYDGVLQSPQGTAVTNAYFGYDFNSSTHIIGSNNGGTFWPGGMANVAWAYTATTFSAQDIIDIDDALNNYIGG